MFMKSYGLKGVTTMYKLLVSTFAILLLASVAFSQATSGVTGVVSDATGKVVPGVAVTLTDTKTDRSFTTTSNDEGSYTFTNIPPGADYKLTFAIQGFSTLALSNVTLGVAKTETYDVTLSAGDVSATVDVVASSSGDTLNTTDPSIGNVIDTRQLRELPIQIRSSPAALISLQPGVVGNNVGTGTTNRVGSVTGSRADQGNITVDGIDANDQATGQFAATVGNAPIDAIQEFRAITVNPSSSEGRSSGGQVQLVTKSGTNEFHGSLRLYNRNEKFAANSFFNNRSGVKRPKLNRNQFGGNIGGPLPFPNFGVRDEDYPFWNSGKDRLFFFFDYEARRDAQEVSYTRTVPLNHFRNGSLAYISGALPGCAGARLNTNPGCITILTPAQVQALDPLGVGGSPSLLSFINSRYPAANDLTLGDGLNTGGLRFNAPSSRKDNTYTTRFDGNINDRQKAFVRFNIARRNQTDTVNAVAAQYPGDPPSALIVVKDYSIAAGHNWSITDSLYNSLTIGNSHSGLDFPNDFNPNFPNEFTFGTLSAPFQGIDTQSRNVDTPTFRDDATWVKGSHTLLFGASFKPIKSVSGLVNDFNTVGVGLGGGLTTLDASVRPGVVGPAITSGTANYDASFAFLLGRIGSLATTYTYSRDGIANAPGTGKLRDFRYNEYEYYVQDNWKIRSDLTINLGLRYQYYSPPYEKNGFQAGNDVDLNELLAKRVANAAAGIASPTSEPLLSYTLIGKGNDARPYYEGDKNNFAPRVGFAYSPSFNDGILKTIFGDRKTSIRGGGSIVYERVGGGLTFIQDQVSYLFDNAVGQNFGGVDPVTDLINDPRFVSISTIPVANTPPTITNPFVPFVDKFGPFGLADGAFNYTIAQDFQVPYSYQYSIGFQRELPGNFLLDVSYAGRLGKKLFTQADAAQVMNFKDPVSGQFLFDALNAIQTQLQTGGSATVTPQPFFENVIGANRGGCPPAPSSCTALVVNNATRRNFIFRGDTGDLIQNMFLNTLLGNPLLAENQGISAQFADNIYITNLGKSRYDALLVSLSKRFSQGLSFDINYTYSHSKDNNSSVANTVIGGLVQDVLNPDVGYGPSDFDIRHLANANFIWELPFGRGKWIGGNANGFLNTFIGGWQMSGIYTYRSGLPMSVGTNSFPLSFTLEAPAVYLGGNASGNIDTTTASNINFFGTPAQAAEALAAFRNVRNGESGSRNVLRGPSFWNFDLSLAKNFSLPWEGHRIQLRMDAFNVFNRNVFANPSTLTLNGQLVHNNTTGLTRTCTATSASCTFGQITTSASAPREVQFAVRWDF
jgi:hypothetical protein